MYVTPKREKLSLFTMPLDHDTAHMVIPTPKVDNSLGSAFSLSSSFLETKFCMLAD